MKKYHVVLCVVVCLLATPQMRADEGGDDLEQIPSCGAVFPDTQIWQGPNYAKRVHGYSQSRRSLDGCFSRMRVEAWIEGVAMFPQIAEGYGIAVSTNFEVPVPFYMPYSAKGKHWLINFGLWLWAGWSHDDTIVVPPPQPPTAEDPQYLCEIIQQGRWIGGECQPPNSPLLFDRNGDGFHLTSADEGVLFDIDADGDLDQVAWTRADSGDAWLALDRNGNGVIDDATELFGNHTPAYPNQRLLTAAHGFAALDFLQGPDYGPSYADSIIDHRDAMFRRLLLWTDSNHNGISEPSELESASGAGLVSVSRECVERKRRDEHGNEFKLKGQSWWLNDSGTIRKEVVWDVWLRTAR